MAKCIQLFTGMFFAAILAQSCHNCKDEKTEAGGATGTPPIAVKKDLTEGQINIKVYAIRTENEDVKTLLLTGNAVLFGASTGSGERDFLIANAQVSGTSITILDKSKTYFEDKSGLCPDICDFTSLAKAKPLTVVAYDGNDKTVIDNEIKAFVTDHKDHVNSLNINVDPVKTIFAENAKTNFILVTVFAGGDKGEVTYQGFIVSDGIITGNTKPQIDLAPITAMNATPASGAH